MRNNNSASVSLSSTTLNWVKDSTHYVDYQKYVFSGGIPYYNGDDYDPPTKVTGLSIIHLGQGAVYQRITTFGGGTGLPTGSLSGVLTFSIGAGCNLNVAWSGTDAELPGIAMQKPGESPGLTAGGDKPLAAPPALSPNRLIKYRSNSGLHKLLLFAPPAGQTWRLYYYAGGTRVAMREVTSAGSTVSYLFGDHLGSTSITANSSGAYQTELRYKAWEKPGSLPAPRRQSGSLKVRSMRPAWDYTSSTLAGTIAH